MPVLSLLADPVGYDPCSNADMHVEHAYREHWIAHFEHHFDSIVRLAIEQYGPESRERALACKDDFVTWLHAVRANPMMIPKLDILTFDAIRQEKLIAHGIPDPFEKTKARENEACLPLYPRVVAELDSQKNVREELLLATEGVFAGNIFDLGAGVTTKMFANSSPDFFAVRNNLGGRRPWLVDHFDALADRLLSSGHTTHKQAMFFCDNAGSDLLLGVLPFCRFLAKRGTRTIIAANDLPALNDITYKELTALLPRLQAIDPILDSLVESGQLLLINSGGTAPLIDLRKISEEVNHHAKQTDLLILEGMGRALESNFDATFTVDALKLAMIKDEAVAERHHGKNFDTVCRFDPVKPHP